MMAIVVQHCDLRTLALGRPGMSPAKGASLAEAAAVCLDSQGHSSGLILRVIRKDDVDCVLTWNASDDQQRQTYADIAEATEEGACAIALCAVEAIAGLVVMERSRKRSAFDYWLGDKPGHLFQRTVRLEVSGILQGDATMIEKRLTEKLQRLERYRSRLPAIVAVVEFGTPQVRLE